MTSSNKDSDEQRVARKVARSAAAADIEALLRERSRLSQARYRERHAERLALARKVSAILVRQKRWPKDGATLAAMLYRPLGKECTKALRHELLQVLKAKPTG
jgi:hypothetical protein